MAPVGDAVADFGTSALLSLTWTCEEDFCVPVGAGAGFGGDVGFTAGPPPPDIGFPCGFDATFPVVVGRSTFWERALL